MLATDLPDLMLLGTAADWLELGQFIPGNSGAGGLRGQDTRYGRARSIITDAVQSGSDNGYLAHSDQESIAASELIDVVNQEAEALLEARGPEAERLFRSLATGKATLIRDHNPTWLTICEGTEQTKAQANKQLLRDRKLAPKTIQTAPLNTFDLLAMVDEQRAH